MDNKSEPNNIKPDDKVEDTKEKVTAKSEPEKVETSQEKMETSVEEGKTDNKTEEDSSEKEPEESKTPAEVETKEVTEKKEKKTEQKPEKAKAAKKDSKKEDDDFQYIVRIANTDIDGNKKVVHGLTMIKGVGMHVSSLVTDRAGIDKKQKIGNLPESDIDKIRKALDEFTENAPSWMLNHRKDYETGEDIHLIGSDIDMQLRDEINIMKKIRSYRGIRHERGLPVRGQRTRANNRRGLALGVSKKRETTGNK